MEFTNINFPTNPVSYNNNDSFLRRVAVGLSSYLYDTLFIPNKSGDDIIMERIPTYYSITGDYQTLMDIFMDGDKYCNDLCLVPNGNTNRVPSGVFTFGSPTADTSDAMSKYERGNFYIERKDEWGSDVIQNNSTIRWVAITIPVDIKYRCATASERFKIWECFMRTYYSTRKFWIRYQGIERIPVLLKFQDNIKNNAKIPSLPINPSDDYYVMETSMDVYTHFPIIDPMRLRNSDNRMDNRVYNITAKK